MKGLGVRFTPTKKNPTLGRLKHHKRASFRWFLIRTQLGSLIIAVMAMAISYNWLFQWDEIHSINGVFLVLITGKWP